MAAGVLTASLLGGVGTGVAVHHARSGGDDSGTAGVPSQATAAPTPTPTLTPTTTATEPTSDEPASPRTPRPSSPSTVPVASLGIFPAAVGPVAVGMSKKAALATGYFDADVSSEVCEGTYDLRWKSAYQPTVDVLTDADGSVFSIGVKRPGPQTRSGLQVGTSMRRVQAVIGDAPVRPAGYGQTGLFEHDGDRWIGFLFDAAPGDVTSDSTVSFIEVTRGARPGLVRDGC